MSKRLTHVAEAVRTGSTADVVRALRSFKETHAPPTPDEAEVIVTPRRWSKIPKQFSWRSFKNGFMLGFWLNIVGGFFATSCKNEREDSPHYENPLLVERKIYTKVKFFELTMDSFVTEDQLAKKDSKPYDSPVWGKHYNGNSFLAALLFGTIVLTTGVAGGLACGIMSTLFFRRSFRNVYAEGIADKKRRWVYEPPEGVYISGTQWNENERILTIILSDQSARTIELGTGEITACRLPPSD